MIILSLTCTRLLIGLRPGQQTRVTLRGGSDPCDFVRAEVKIGQKQALRNSWMAPSPGRMTIENQSFIQVCFLLWYCICMLCLYHLLLCFGETVIGWKRSINTNSSTYVVYCRSTVGSNHQKDPVWLQIQYRSRLLWRRQTHLQQLHLC